MSIQATFTPVNGVFGELLGVSIVYVEGAIPDLTFMVSSGTNILLTISTTAGIANLRWDQMAVQFNADITVNILAIMFGESSKTVPDNKFATAIPGFAGEGLGQFYSAPAPAPPPPVRPAKFCRGVLSIT